jgi:hypothetical protein
MIRRKLICGVIAFVFAWDAEAAAQQSRAPNFEQSYETAVGKARQECTVLFADHAFDALRKHIPLGEQKPTFEMLKSGEKLKSKEKPVADLAIKTLEKCRRAWGDVYAMLPPQVSSMIHGVERQQDSIIAELYRGKITFGDFNAGMNRLNGELSAALSGVQVTPAVAQVAAEAKSAAASDTSAGAPSNEIRLALVIGNSSYANLPKLSNPENDAHSIADALKAMG